MGLMRSSRLPEGHQSPSRGALASKSGIELFPIVPAGERLCRLSRLAIDVGVVWKPINGVNASGWRAAHLGYGTIPTENGMP